MVIVYKITHTGLSSKICFQRFLYLSYDGKVGNLWVFETVPTKFSRDILVRDREAKLKVEWPYLDNFAKRVLWHYLSTFPFFRVLARFQTQSLSSYKVFFCLFLKIYCMRTPEIHIEHHLSYDLLVFSLRHILQT